MKYKWISWRVKEQTYQCVREKAELYEVPMSDLTRLAVEAYMRTYDELPEEGGYVAVNYAVWLRCESLLADIEEELKNSTRQLVAARRAIQVLQREDLVGEGDLGSATEVILACHGTVQDMREKLEQVRTVHDAACQAILVLDNSVWKDAQAIINA